MRHRPQGSAKLQNLKSLFGKLLITTGLKGGPVAAALTYLAGLRGLKDVAKLQNLEWRSW